MKKRKFQRGDRVVWNDPDHPPDRPEIFGTVVSGVETSTKNRYKVRWEIPWGKNRKSITRWDLAEDMSPAHPLLLLAEEAP